jgi:hypothetical protein
MDVSNSSWGYAWGAESGSTWGRRSRSTWDAGCGSGGGGSSGEARAPVGLMGAGTGGRAGVVGQLVTPGSVRSWLAGLGDEPTGPLP